MKTTMFARFSWLVCLFALLTGQEGSKAENYDAWLLQYGISLTPPNPADPFAGLSSNLHFTDPLVQISTTTPIYVVMRYQFVGRESGMKLAIKQPNFTSAALTMQGRKEQNGNSSTGGLGGSMPIDFGSATYTDRAGFTPAPTSNVLWMYGLDTCGCLATTPGDPIKDPNAITLVNSSGTFKVGSNPDVRVAEFHVCVVGYMTQGFVNGYNGLLTLSNQFHTDFRLFIEITSPGLSMDSLLGPEQGCNCTVKYPEGFRWPTIYCCNQNGAVLPSIEDMPASPAYLLGYRLRNRRMSNWVVQESRDLINWSTATTYTILAKANGDTEIIIPRSVVQSLGPIGFFRPYDPGPPP